jgi:RNase P subunit RPR2
MSQQQSSYSPSNPLIPQLACPRCRSVMKLALMEPAALSASGRDTLVFQCTCGFSYKQPMEVGGRNSAQLPS